MDEEREQLIHEVEQEIELYQDANPLAEQMVRFFEDQANVKKSFEYRTDDDEEILIVGEEDEGQDDFFTEAPAFQEEPKNERMSRSEAAVDMAFDDSEEVKNPFKENLAQSEALPVVMGVSINSDYINEQIDKKKSMNSKHQQYREKRRHQRGNHKKQNLSIHNIDELGESIKKEISDVQALQGTEEDVETKVKHDDDFVIVEDHFAKEADKENEELNDRDDEFQVHDII